MKLFVTILVLFLASICNAQHWLPVSQASPKFQAFYAKFRSAEQKGDKAAVASLSAFPFERNYGSDAEQYARADFIERYDEMFDKAAVFSTDDPTIFEFKSGYIALFDDAGSKKHFMFKPDASGANGYSYYSQKEWVSIKLVSMDAEFQTFYAKLRTTVAGRNNTTIAALTQFPFKKTTLTYDQDKNTTVRHTIEYSKPDFIKKMKLAIGDFPKAPEFLVNGDGRFNVLCEEYTDDTCSASYYFEKVDGGYKLTEIEADGN